MPMETGQLIDEEFLPSCEVNFDLPPESAQFQNNEIFSTPTKFINKKRESFSPIATNWPVRVRQLERQLFELEEFTKLEQEVGIYDERDEMAALKKELKDAYAELLKYKEEHMELLQIRGGLYDIKEVPESSEQ